MLAHRTPHYITCQSAAQWLNTAQTSSYWARTCLNLHLCACVIHLHVRNDNVPCWATGKYLEQCNLLTWASECQFTLIWVSAISKYLFELVPIKKKKHSFFNPCIIILHAVLFKTFYNTFKSCDQMYPWMKDIQQAKTCMYLKLIGS